MESKKESLKTPPESVFDFSAHKFIVPTKKIDDPVTLEVFRKSTAAQELLSFIGALS
jgi:hypothetical protein